MNPIAAARQNLFNVHLEMRSGRVEWWATRLALGVFSGLLCFWVVPLALTPGTKGTILGVWALYAVLISVSVTIRRLHDLDKPVWVLSVPIVAFFLGYLPPALDMPQILQEMINAAAIFAPSPSGGLGPDQMRAMLVTFHRGVQASYSASLFGQAGFAALMFGGSCQLVLFAALGFGRGVAGANRLGMAPPGMRQTRAEQRRQYLSPEMAEKMERMERARRIDAERTARESAIRGH